jgi:hypothetical protein
VFRDGVPSFLRVCRVFGAVSQLRPRGLLEVVVWGTLPVCGHELHHCVRGLGDSARLLPLLVPRPQQQRQFNRGLRRVHDPWRRSSFQHCGRRHLVFHCVPVQPEQLLLQPVNRSDDAFAVMNDVLFEEPLYVPFS